MDLEQQIHLESIITLKQTLYLMGLSSSQIKEELNKLITKPIVLPEDNDWKEGF